MIRAAENAKSYQKAGNLRHPRSWRDRLSELVPEDWTFDPLEAEVDRKPDSAEAWFELGEEERQRGYFRDALASYEKAIELNRDYALAFVRSGEACFALREYTAAIKQSSKAIEVDPELIEAYTLRASAYERSQNYEEAVKDHSVALVLKGQPVRAKERRSLASEVAGKVIVFFVQRVAQPAYQAVAKAVRSPVMQQRLAAMRTSISKNIRGPVQKFTQTKRAAIKGAKVGSVMRAGAVAGKANGGAGVKAKTKAKGKAKVKAKGKGKVKAKGKAKVKKKAQKKTSRKKK